MKLKGKRETRLLALVALGQPLEVAARAVGISRMTVSRHRREDPAFAVLLADARARADRSALPDLGPEPMDWREAAKRLEASDPLRWLLPGDPGDPFDIDTGA
jgi:hypothetical protein